MDKRRILLYTLAGAVSAWAGANAFLGGGDAPPAAPEKTTAAPGGAPPAQVASVQPVPKPVSPTPPVSAAPEVKSIPAVPPTALDKAPQSPTVINSQAQPTDAQAKPAAAIAPIQPAPVQSGAVPMPAAPAIDAKIASPLVPAQPVLAKDAAPAPAQATEAAPTAKAPQPASPVTAETATAKQPERAVLPAVQPAVPPSPPASVAVKDEAAKLQPAKAEPVAPAPAAKIAKTGGKAAGELAKVWDESTRSISDKERSEAEARDKGAPEFGLPDDHPMVRDVLAKYKGEPLVLCVGGCEGDTVVLDRSSASTSPRVYVPSSAWASRRVKEYGDGPGTPDRDVICVAGCNGAKGAAVWKPVRHSALSRRVDGAGKAESGNAAKE